MTDLDVGILINNAAEFQHEALDKITPDGLLRASIVNCHTPALFARYFISRMDDITLLSVCQLRNYLILHLCFYQPFSINLTVEEPRLFPDSCPLK